MNFDEWYRNSPTSLRTGPTAEDLERGRKLRERIYIENRCINFPCALEYRHEGPCSSMPQKGVEE